MFTIGSIASTMPSVSRGPRPAAAVVRNLRLLVQLRADAVPDELAHHREAVRLDVALHRVRRCPRSATRPGRGRCPGAATPRSRAAASPRPRSSGRPARVTAASPKKPSRTTPRSIDDDVALDQLAARRDAVHHLFVHRRANRRRVAVIALERRLGAAARTRDSACASRSAVVTPGATASRSSAENLGHERVGRSHPLQLRRRLADDHVVLARAPAPFRWRAFRSAVTWSGACSPLIRLKVRPAPVEVHQRRRLALEHLSRWRITAVLSSSRCTSGPPHLRHRPASTGPSPPRSPVSSGTSTPP